jgi:predicted nucleotidyltransferase
MKCRSPVGRKPSGRFLLRLGAGLHAALKQAARVSGLSLNDYCARKPAAPMGIAARHGAIDAVDRAAALAGDALVGLVVFGSWARGDLTDSSDVDVLVVVDRSLRLTRALYRQWDQRPVTWDGRPVEPHFVHLPDAGERVSGLWAEVAASRLGLRRARGSPAFALRATAGKGLRARGSGLKGSRREDPADPRSELARRMKGGVCILLGRFSPR